MKVKVIDCKYLFIDSLIEHVKNNIKDYHAGFMLVDDVLYIPYYEVLSRHFTSPDVYKTDTIELSDVNDFDSLATHFYNVTSLDVEDVIDLYNKWLDNEFEDILNTADEIAQAKYDLGYNDGYDTGAFECL